jgi:hypothetical protein
LHDEIYSRYTEFKEEKKMWEDIKLIDYERIIREREEAVREKKEAVKEREEAVKEKKEAARKLREMGISEEQLAAAGLLEIAGK